MSHRLSCAGPIPLKETLTPGVLEKDAAPMHLSLVVLGRCSGLNQLSVAGSSPAA